jgi:hypothetical protein
LATAKRERLEQCGPDNLSASQQDRLRQAESGRQNVPTASQRDTGARGQVQPGATRASTMDRAGASASTREMSRSRDMSSINRDAATRSRGRSKYSAYRGGGRGYSGGMRGGGRRR